MKSWAKGVLYGRVKKEHVITYIYFIRNYSEVCLYHEWWFTIFWLFLWMMMDMVLTNFMSSSQMTNSPFGWYLLFQEIWKQICKKCILILKKTASCALSDCNGDKKCAVFWQCPPSSDLLQ